MEQSNDFMNSMNDFMDEMAEKCDMTTYWERTKQSIQNSIYQRKIDEIQEQKWEGFLEPEEKMNLDQVFEDIENAEIKLEIVVHSPYYRKKIHEYCEEKGYKHKSIVKKSNGRNDDSTYFVHFDCKKCTPLRKVRRSEDWGLSGSYMGSLYYCDHCDTTVCVDDHYDPQFDRYTFAFAKNTMIIQKFYLSYTNFQSYKKFQNLYKKQKTLKRDFYYVDANWSNNLKTALLNNGVTNLTEAELYITYHKYNYSRYGSVNKITAIDTENEVFFYKDDDYSEFYNIMSNPEEHICDEIKGVYFTAKLKAILIQFN